MRAVSLSLGEALDAIIWTDQCRLHYQGPPRGGCITRSPGHVGGKNLQTFLFEKVHQLEHIVELEVPLAALERP